MSARGLLVLGRFPLHVAATDPGKRFGSVVDAFADELDVLTRQVGDVRSNHRLREATTLADLLGLAGLHGLGAVALALVEIRLRALAAAAAGEPVDPVAVGRLINVRPETLEGIGAAIAVLATRPTHHLASMALRRQVISGAVLAHRVGNATPTALLTAAATYLGLEVDEVQHSEDRWWHFAHCHDLLRLSAPAGVDPLPDLSPQADIVALEENPFRPADLEPTARRHGQRFRVQRAGLQDVDVSVRVRGVAERTVRPVVVHIESGRGLAYEGNVPAGQQLVFAASGRVTLDGVDVTGSAWAFEGGVFAAASEPLSGKDFVFADDGAPGTFGDRDARFALTTPLPDAFGPAAAFPHGAPAVGPLRLPRGRSHWVALARVAHAGLDASTPAVPRTSAGHFDGSVFAPPPSPMDPSFEIGFAWEEREPFAVRVVVPRRFDGLGDEAGTPLRELLRLLLDRHRAGGVDVRVEYADPRWTLGVGLVRDTEEEPLGTVIAGTELWPDNSSPNP
jgi:hypothetical protein